MTKIETNLEHFLHDIETFYDYTAWFFTTVNCVELDSDSVEIQYIFSKYRTIDETVVYFMSIPYDAIVPSISSLIPSAIMSEREIVDLFGISIEGIEKGLYLDSDSEQTPLKGGCSV
jgi:NADH:ubiquinone oxidoreductase subunit C